MRGFQKSLGVKTVQPTNQPTKHIKKKKKPTNLKNLRCKVSYPDLTASHSMWLWPSVGTHSHLCSDLPKGVTEPSSLRKCLLILWEVWGCCDFLQCSVLTLYRSRTSRDVESLNMCSFLSQPFSFQFPQLVLVSLFEILLSILPATSALQDES